MEKVIRDRQDLRASIRKDAQTANNLRLHDNRITVALDKFQKLQEKFGEEAAKPSMRLVFGGFSNIFSSALDHLQNGFGDEDEIQDTIVL